MHSMRNTTILLVNWRRAQDTCMCIDSLLAHANESCLSICENASPDDSLELLRVHLRERFIEKARAPSHRYSRFVFEYFEEINGLPELAPKITLVATTHNLGFAGGNNVALQEHRREGVATYFWFLNNDTEIEASSLGALIRHMELNPGIGICGSTLVYAHDRKTVQAFGGARYNTFTGGVQEIGNGAAWPCTVDSAQVEKSMRYVSGASMLVSARFLEQVGLMSEDYFLYYEEIDWATRAERAGFRLGYAKDSVVYHKEGAALGSGKSQQRSLLAEYYGLRNRLVFTANFFPWALPTAYAFSCLQAGKRLLQGRWAPARLMLAVLTGLRRTPPLAR